MTRNGLTFIVNIACKNIQGPEKRVDEERGRLQILIIEAPPHKEEVRGGLLCKSDPR